MIRNLLALALAAALFVAFLPSNPAEAKKKKKRPWQRHTVTLVCDTASTTVTIQNPNPLDVTVMVTLSDAGGGDTSTETIPMLGVIDLSCADLGVQGIAVLTVESPYVTEASVIYERDDGMQVMPVERTLAPPKRMPIDDEDSDSDDDSDADTDSRVDEDSDADSDTDYPR